MKVKNKIFVIGHVNPDTDSIASAIGYAWFLRERDNVDAVAARAGVMNPQTSWVIDRLSIEAPILLTDASPRFNEIVQRLDTTTPENPLQDAWAILNRTGGVAPIVDSQNGKPCGLITGFSLFNFFVDVIGPHPKLQEMRLAEILELPCKDACDTNVPKFYASTRIRDVINRILRAEHNEFIIIDDDGSYMGVCRQRDVLKPPRMKIILVDHNEPSQAIGSLEEAELIEVLDHHRLGNLPTHAPIRFTIDIVGSTSTLVSERIEETGLSAPPKVAGMLLAGLLADTLVLTSPTTTNRDHIAASRLGRWAFVPNGPLKGETVESFGKQLLDASAGLITRDAWEVINTDLKLYEATDFKFAVAQVEVTNMLQFEENAKGLEKALVRLRENKGLDFVILMVTNVVNGSSRLLIVNAPAILDDLPYRRLPDGTLLAEGVVSRKKQLIPTLLSLIEA